MMEKNIHIFDFDGTLTTETWPKFWTWTKKFGFDGTKRNEKLENALMQYRGKSNGSFLETFFGFFNDMLVNNNASLTHDEIMDGEKYIQYNSGVSEYFKSSKDKNYIVSGGLVEFLKGLEISKYFDGIYGTSSVLNAKGLMTGIGEVMTDERKALAIQDILKRNGKQPDDCSGVTFVGDGASDIAAWRYVHNNGGRAVFVHQPTGNEDEWHNQLEQIYQRLKSEGIIDYKCVADYRAGSDLVNILGGTAKLKKSDE